MIFPLLLISIESVYYVFLSPFLDGFDLTVIGVALPKVAEYLNTSPGSLGFALAVGQFGPLVGAIFLGMLADRFGRKWMLFFSALIFGIFHPADSLYHDGRAVGSVSFSCRNRFGWGYSQCTGNCLGICPETGSKLRRCDNVCWHARRRYVWWSIWLPTVFLALVGNLFFL